ncbi:MAG: XRE family transcriptional regulator [Chlorobiales bacterium]|nr:XRE family transcriptional regulator [Chlorobiales bacterium]
MPDKSTHFGKCLRHIRKSESLTIQSFAEKLGISKSFISEVERGEKEPGYKLIKSLKRIYPSLNLNHLIAEENALPDMQRLEILEKRVNRLFDIVQENTESYEIPGIVDVPFFPDKPEGNGETEYIKLSQTLVKNNRSFAFRCKESLLPEIQKGDIVLATPELDLKDQSIALLHTGNRLFLAKASFENRKVSLRNNTGREITLQEQNNRNKILGVVYLIIKTVY